MQSPIILQTQIFLTQHQQEQQYAEAKKKLCELYFSLPTKVLPSFESIVEDNEEDILTFSYSKEVCVNTNED